MEVRSGKYVFGLANVETAASMNILEKLILLDDSPISYFWLTETYQKRGKIINPEDVFDFRKEFKNLGHIAALVSG